jgi:hypothetical protein
MRHSTVILILFSLLIVKPTYSANVFFALSDEGWPIVKIEGDIVKGDYFKVKQAASKIVPRKDFNALRFYLNSVGGDIEEAIRIGYLVRELLVHVYALGNTITNPESEEARWIENYLKKNPDDAYKFDSYRYVVSGAPIKEEYLNRCYTACILIFYGGARRDASDNLDDTHPTIRKYIPTIGIHRPYYESEYFGQLSPSDAHKEYKKLEAKVRAYLDEMDAPQSLADRMFKVASNEIELIEHDEFKTLYQREAPYLTEWLIAKCGNLKVEGFLSDQEHKDWQDLTKARKKERREMEKLRKKGGEIDWDYFYSPFTPKGFSEERVKYLQKKVVAHNRPIRECRQWSILRYQAEWAITSE